MIQVVVYYLRVKLSSVVWVKMELLQAKLKGTGVHLAGHFQ
jgi:hypothetical protein